MSTKHKTVYRAANGYTVREIRYSTIRGLLVPDCAGAKWFELFDAEGNNYCNFTAGERPFAAICAAADAGDSAAAYLTP